MNAEGKNFPPAIKTGEKRLESKISVKLGRNLIDNVKMLLYDKSGIANKT